MGFFYNICLDHFREDSGFFIISFGQFSALDHSLLNIFFWKKIKMNDFLAFNREKIKIDDSQITLRSQFGFPSQKIFQQLCISISCGLVSMKLSGPSNGEDSFREDFRLEKYFLTSMS